MARLRFPGRPGCRFGRKGVRYGADEADNFQDPVLAWVANIHRGLRQFRELCGESDEDGEFEGFTVEDVKKAEYMLAKHEAEFYEDEKDKDTTVSPDTSFSPTTTNVVSTRFTKQRESLENLPTSERTRNREKTVIRRSYKDILTKGFTTPTKSYFITSRKNMDTPQVETKKSLTTYYKTSKIISPEMNKYYEQGFKIKKSGKFKGARVIYGSGRPKYLKTVVRNWYRLFMPPDISDEDLDDIPTQYYDIPQHRKRKERDKKLPVVSTVVKRGRKNIVKTLLDKAKKGKDDNTFKKGKLPVKKKQFVLPTQSSRSSRVIIPNKRFIEEDSEKVAKRRKEDNQNIFDTSLLTSFKRPFSSPSSQKNIEKLHIQTDFPYTSGFGSFSPSVYKKASLFDQPLITEGKRERRPSQKLKVKMTEGSEDEFIDVLSNSLSSDGFNETRKVHLTPSKLGQSMHSPTIPMVSPIFAPPKFGSTPFRSLTQQSNDVEATKRSGHNILRKAKLQLNRAAVNRSKAELAKSLKKEMKREERNKNQMANMALAYSTISRRSKSYIDAGPENEPIQRSGTDLCKVCGGLPLRPLMRKVICNPCYKCYKRYSHFAKDPCQNNRKCDIRRPNKFMCKPCKYQKCCQVYLSGVEKSKSKSPLKVTAAKLPVKVIERRKTLEKVPERKSQREKVMDRKSDVKRQSHVPVIEAPSLVVTETEEPFLLSPALPVETADQSDETTTPEVSPQAGTRGPRIKHVCRKAAVVLGKTVARFPQTELTLSALPKGEKKRLLKQDELDKAAYSDDEKTIEEIIQEAEEGADTYVKSPPVKIIPKMKTHKTPPSFLKMIKRKRKLRCKKCAGCTAEDCGECNYCLDKPKFGGRGVMKQACIHRRCTNPQYYKAATALTLEPKDDDTDSLGNPQCSSGAGPEDEMNNNTSSNSSKSCLNVLRRYGQKSNSNISKILLNQNSEYKDMQSSDITPGSISRQLQFSGNSQGSQHQLSNISRVSSRAQNSGRMSTKVPPAVPYRNEQTQSQQSRKVSQNWARIRPHEQAQHRLKADFKEIYNIWSAWQFGVSLTVAAPLCCRTLCFLCGSAGKHELFYCNVCCEPFHEFCLEEDEKPASDNLENWVCRKCQFCTVCGQQKNLLKCDKCQNTYHPECLGPNYPTKPSKKNIWICTKCVKCKSCGATTPGTTSNATWTHDFQLCYVCGQLMDKGNFCPICHKCYSDDDWDCKMLQCVKCDSWVHANCEGLSDEMYERVSCLPEDVNYICRMCAGNRLRHWELVLKDDFIAGIKSIFYSIFNAKCSRFLEVDHKEQGSDRNIVLDESSNDSISSKESKCDTKSVAMEIDKPTSVDTSVVSKSVVFETDEPVSVDTSVVSKSVVMETDKPVVMETDKPVQVNTSVNLTNTCNQTFSNENNVIVNAQDTVSSCTYDISNKEGTVAMETSNSLLSCDSKVVNVCDKESDINVTSKSLGEPDGNKSYVLKTTADVELFIKNLEGLVQKKVATEQFKSESSAISKMLPTSQEGLSAQNISENKTEKSIQFSTDSNSSSVNSQTEDTQKTPEKKGAVVRFKESLPKPVPTRDYPQDLMTVRQKIIAGVYITVEEFSEDIAYIIETALTNTEEEQGVVRKKAINSVRSIFVKQMEKCFPWYNVKACRMWEHNRFLPQNMLANAVLPPFEDHTYAQWLEREDVPRSPQPSPFKKSVETPIKKIFPLVDPEEEEKVLSSDLADDGQDTRRCILCWHYGDADPNRAGRLLYGGQDDWVHVNCALWSAEVFEEGRDGSLQNVLEAISRGKKMKCDTCQRTGATVGCCTRGCPANYHFMCARMDGCVFQEDKKMFCSQHRDKVDGELVTKENFAVLRRVCVDREGMKITKKTWTKGLTAAEINIIIGSCTIESIGNLSALSDCKGLLLPVGFSCTRVYWSTKDSRRRCVYTCKITEYHPESPKSPEATIKDMTIIHDHNHPNYIPLSRLELPETMKRANIVDLTEDSMYSEDSSRTLSATFDRTRSSSVDCDDSLSSSWPGPSKKRRSDPVPLDLSLLSPTTLRLLNKDPEKYRKESVDSQADRSFNKSLPPVLPTVDKNPLAQIASRLNNAAARSRQKSEERMVAGITTIMIPDRPSSAPLFSRSRSNSSERLMSPPRLCSSPKSESLPPVAESSDIISINDDDHSNAMETDDSTKSIEIDKSLEEIINELSGEDENALIVITEDGQELTDDDYAMIAQYNINCNNQSEPSDKNSSESDPLTSAIRLTSNTQIVKLGQEISVQEVLKERPAIQLGQDKRDASKEGVESTMKESVLVIGKECVQMVQKDAAQTAKTPTVRKEAIQNVQHEAIKTVQKDTFQKSENQIFQPVAIKNAQEKAIKTVHRDAIQTVQPVQKEAIKIVQNHKNDFQTSLLKMSSATAVFSSPLPQNIETYSTDLSVDSATSSKFNDRPVLGSKIKDVTRGCEPEISKTTATTGATIDLTCNESNPASPITCVGKAATEDKESGPDITITEPDDCPILEKSIGDEAELTADAHHIISMPILTIESPIKAKMITDKLEKVEILKSIEDASKAVKEFTPYKILDDGEPNCGSAGKTTKSEQESMFKSPSKFILSEETGDFIPKPESPIEEPVKILPKITASKNSKGKMAEGDESKREAQHSKSRNLFESLNLTPTDTMVDEENKEEILKGLGLERTPSPGKERKSYPLRRRSMLKEDTKEPLHVEIPLHDKLTQKIKAESMAKSSPGEEGPFKCQTCKRHYRTQESYQKHVSNCDFEISSTTDEEEEADAEKRGGRYPMRETTIVQSVVSQVEEQERKSGVKKPGRSSFGQRARHDSDLSPKVILDRLSPSKWNSSSDKNSSITVKRGRGRPPKINVTSPVAEPKHSVTSPVRNEKEKSQLENSVKRKRGRPPLLKTSESEKQREPVDTNKPRSRGRPRLDNFTPKSRPSIDKPSLKDQQRNVFKSKYLHNKYGKFHKRSKSDGFLLAARMGLSENPYAKHYLFKTHKRYREKCSAVESIETKRNKSKKRTLVKRRKSDISHSSSATSSRRSSVTLERRKSKDMDSSKEVDVNADQIDDFDDLDKSIEISLKDSNKSSQKMEESIDHGDDGLSTLQQQVKRKRGRPKKIPKLEEKKESTEDKLQSAEGSSDKEQEICNKSDELSSKDNKNCSHTDDLAESNSVQDMEISGPSNDKLENNTDVKEEKEVSDVKSNINEAIENSQDFSDSEDSSDADTQSVGRSDYEDVLDKEIKQEILDEEEFGNNLQEKEKKGGEIPRSPSPITDQGNAIMDQSVEEKKEITNEERSQEQKTDVESPNDKNVNEELGSAVRPVVIDDDDDDYELGYSKEMHDHARAKRIYRKRKEKSPRKSIDEESHVSLKSSPGVKALSHYLAHKEKTPPKNDLPSPVVSSSKEVGNPKTLFKSDTLTTDTVSHKQFPLNKGVLNIPATVIPLNKGVTMISGSVNKSPVQAVIEEKIKQRKSLEEFELKLISDELKQRIANRRLSDEGKNAGQTSNRSSDCFEERNIFQVLNKDPPRETSIGTSKPHSAIKPAAEYSHQSTKGPPPLMTPSLIGVHNPALSLTAFQQLQQNMPHALQQIHGSGSGIIPYTSKLSTSVNLPTSQPTQDAIRSPFDMEQHIRRMITETSLAAGPIHQSQVLQQMVLNQSIQAGGLSQNKPVTNPHTYLTGSQQISMHTANQNKSQQCGTNSPIPSTITASTSPPKSSSKSTGAVQQETSITSRNIGHPPSSRSKLIPYNQLMQKNFPDKATIIPKFINPPNQPIPMTASLPAVQSIKNQQQSTSSAITPLSKPSTGAKPNTIVRIFVDGKPVALTTDPTVLQDHTSLLNKLGSGQIQSGTYSVTVSAHRIPSVNTSPVNTTGTNLPAKVPAIQPVLPPSQQAILPQSMQNMNSAQFLARNSNIKDAIDSQMASKISALTSRLSPSKQNQVLSSMLSTQNQFPSNLRTAIQQHNIYSDAIPREIRELMKKVPLPERPTPSISVQPKIMTSYVKKLDGTVQKKMLVKPMIVNRKRPAINPINITGSASKKPSVSTYLEKNGIMQGLLSKVYMRKLIKDGSPKPKMADGTQQTELAGHNYSSKAKGGHDYSRKAKEKVVIRKTGRKKTPRKSRNISKPHAGAGTSHPIIHGPKEVMSLPQPAVEEEVTESSLVSFMEHQQQVQEKAERRDKNGAHLMFEITSDDGFSCKAETMEEAWQQVTERVQDARTTARLKHLSCASVHGVNMFGVNHNAVAYLLEQLYGAQLCRNYKFRYHQYTRTEEEEEPIENPTGSIRSEPYQSRKEFDIFSFLMSQYRRLPEIDFTNADNEMNLKSQRRATSMDLPMAMRFRKLKEHAREAVGVYRSYIHGRGLYCKRNIDAGEMIIEYSGEVIRASLTDKREQYYESKGIGCYMFRIDDIDVVDATLHGSAARFINHSCEPNCYSKVIQVEGKKHIVIFAMRQIKKGEELTYDYKFPIEEVKIPCTCGSKRCRKYLN